jgi:hypothetical protein
MQQRGNNADPEPATRRQLPTDHLAGATLRAEISSKLKGSIKQFGWLQASATKVSSVSIDSVHPVTIRICMLQWRFEKGTRRPVLASDTHICLAMPCDCPSDMRAVPKRRPNDYARPPVSPSCAGTRPQRGTSRCVRSTSRGSVRRVENGLCPC